MYKLWHDLCYWLLEPMWSLINLILILVASVLLWTMFSIYLAVFVAYPAAFIALGYIEFGEFSSYGEYFDVYIVDTWSNLSKKEQKSLFMVHLWILYIAWPEGIFRLATGQFSPQSPEEAVGDFLKVVWSRIMRVINYYRSN